MKKSFLKLTTIVSTFLFVGCNDSNKEKPEYVAALTVEEKIEKGKNLVNVIGCNDCHSPKIMTEKGPIPDPNKLLSGHDANEQLPKYNAESVKGYVLFNMNNTAAVGPWGTSFAANLTPDDTGIGTWSEEQFLKAMKQGKYKGLDGSRQLLPPMPWQSYSQMADEDVKAIFAYLKSLNPVKNIVPQSVPPMQ
ncbi:c-type cytochrome [Flavobacterium suncheonense]|uniref:Diheme cytochrome c-553 n=1 Tax=Flavobacterium suncheonense GH29-5 = DSM 17707 TaxID=1121899 RepID=A0A0A2M7T9_9FLAO|nr:c-type cytochrome [Flavobacterium suncheonense]KGO87666.1 diheme cytochrome c-553 [Flavobacterium suncheonense GH29-5 = DSM 17707]